MSRFVNLLIQKREIKKGSYKLTINKKVGLCFGFKTISCSNNPDDDLRRRGIPLITTATTTNVLCPHWRGGMVRDSGVVVCSMNWGKNLVLPHRAGHVNCHCLRGKKKEHKSLAKLNIKWSQQKKGFSSICFCLQDHV